MSKTLVIYYSRTGENYVNGDIKNLRKGNTEVVAEYIKEAVGADLFQIETVQAYNEDYMVCIDEAKKELRENVRPELKAYIDDISDYDNIVVAGPCWWGTYPMGVFTQLDKLDFTGKNVYPVMTHEGSGLGNATRSLQQSCTGANIGKGLAIHGASVNQAQNTVSNWALENLQ